jgi:hypothetical protein
MNSILYERIKIQTMQRKERECTQTAEKYIEPLSYTESEIVVDKSQNNKVQVMSIYQES